MKPSVHSLQSSFVALLLFLSALLFVFPFFWMFVTSVKPAAELFTSPPQLLPSAITWDAFTSGWNSAPFPRYLWNTIVIAVLNVLGHTAVAALVGFGFAVATFPGRNVLFIVLLATMMIPEQVTMIPLFIMFRWVGWVGTNLPLVVPPFFGFKSAFYIFMMRQFFLTIPRELEEAARVDGAHSLSILVNIYLPLSKSALAAVAVFAFVASWNDFLFPLIFLSRQETWTLALGLVGLANPNYIDYRQVMSAALLISSVPVVVFFFSQKLFTQGITMSGLKG